MLASKEGIKCDGYPEGGLRLQQVLRGNKNYIAGAVKTNVFSSLLKTKVITAQSSWQKIVAPWSLLKFLNIFLQLQTVTMGMYFLVPWGSNPSPSLSLPPSIKALK